MPFISYAQNFEDVLLWRALGSVQRGFFIDVGAHHPDHDSVTRAFSDRGWRGINIEPLPAQAALIRSARPRDVTLQVAVGAAIGNLPFHVVAGTGLSTLDPTIARSYETSSFAVSIETVEVLTLARVCELYAEPEIHFLKIDVEGAELAVLQGADFDRFRPWIILAEATEPRGTRLIHQAWEPLLLAAGYIFVWFDGLNRFYVAAERAESLRPFFGTPPNVFDEFVRAEDNGWISRYDAADVEARHLREQLRSAQDGLLQSAERERRHVEHAGHEIDRLREGLARGAHEIDLLRHRADTAEHMFALRHRDMEELRAARHEARHELQQTHVRLQAAEQECNVALNEVQQTHLRLQATEQERNVALHEVQQTHLRLQATEQERDQARHHGQDVDRQLQAATADLHRLTTELHALRQNPPGLRRLVRGASRRLSGRVGQKAEAGAIQLDPTVQSDAAPATEPHMARSASTVEPGGLTPEHPVPLPGPESGPDAAGIDASGWSEAGKASDPSAVVSEQDIGLDAASLDAAGAPGLGGDQAPPVTPPESGSGADGPDTAVVEPAIVAPGQDGAESLIPTPAEAEMVPVETVLPPLPVSPPPPLVIADGDSDGLRAVHQFHSGSAVGDAITNALLMVRGMLRAMGYESEIFVEQPPPALAHELRTLEELPRHDGYVLLQHHSMGYDRFEQVLALPAPKLLIYHNITPPALLARHPHLAHYAALGRSQLARFRGQVAASLAISDFNGNELRRLGLAPVRTCNLLFDIDAMRRRAAEARPLAATMRQDGVFTVLFVGRITESKNQATLIDAFALFHDRYAAPSRLVLVGRAESADDPYLALLRRRIDDAALGAAVMITGGVSDTVLDGWYGAADLYVSLSRHEGFGVPLVEAMAHGVPVLAFGAGAVPYTLAGAAHLVPDLSPEAVAAQMLALAGDPAARDRQRTGQHASLDRFALPLQARVLQDALLRAGAALPENTVAPASGPDLDQTLRFSVTGHVNGSYSLAAINRDLALALDTARPGRVRLLPVEGTPTLDLSGVPAGQFAAIRDLALRPPHETGPEMVISQHYPVLVPREGPDLAVALLFWEESRLPADTVSLLGRHFDAVVAPTRFVRDVLVESGLPIPVRVIPPALRLERFAALGARRGDTPPSPVHRFLHVSSCFPRKGVDVLLRAWATAFRAGDPVSLVIKGFPNPHNTVAAELDALLARDPDIAPVTLVDRDLDETELLALFEAADTMVLPTRGEGLNLPAAEALAAGLGLIVTGAGGHMDFCTDPEHPDQGRDGVRLLRFGHAPSDSHLATPHSLWLEPDEADLVSALRERVDQTPMRVAPPMLAGPEAIARAYTVLATDLLRAGPRQPVRISWVSSWGVRCGVAEYSRQMLRALDRAIAAGDSTLRVRVLSDRRTPVTENDADAAWPCWTIGDDRSLVPLAAALSADDADAVMLQHQPGLFSFALLADLLAHPALRGRVVMATLHNTVDLLELEPSLLSRLLAGLRGLDRVLVHTEADLTRLHALGVGERMTLLPHGVPPALPPRPIRVLSPGEAAPRIGCYGFFLPGKGIDVLIEAVAILRRRWPRAVLVLVNAEYDAAVSAEEIERCRVLAETLGIADAVSFETGFLPNRVSLDLLSECDVVALCYRPSKEASSAALRGALAASVPVAVTPIALFEEADTAVSRFSGLDAPSVAADLDRLLSDAGSRASLQDRAQVWMAARQWDGIARQVAGMATGLVRTARLYGGR